MYIHRDGEYEPITTTPPSFTNADRIRSMTDEIRYPTNYDKITHMSVEELAKFINFHTVCLECPAARSCKDSFTTDPTVCVSNLIEWLKQEVEA